MKTLKRFSALALAALLLVGLVPTLGSAQSTYNFRLQIMDETGNPITSGIRCFVYDSGTDTRATLYSDTSGTALSNPVTGSSAGECSWYSTASTAVDVVAFYTTKGAKARRNGVTIYDHRLVMVTQAGAKSVKLPFVTSNNETSTGFTIPKGAVLREVVIENNAAVTGGHIAVGIYSGETGGDPDGFCGGGASLAGGSPTFGRDLNTTGMLGCHAVIVTATKLVSPNFYLGAFHVGVLLARGSVGNDDAGAAGHAGNYFRYPFIGNGVAKTVVYTTNAYTGAHGHIHLLFDELNIGG